MNDICSALFAAPAAVASSPHGGSLLVAEPFLDEDCFCHAVVSLIDYEPGGGAMGVVLNHRSPSMLSELLEDADVRVDCPVYIGGPLASDRLFFMHTLGDGIIPGARAYAPGLYVGGDFDAILEYVNSGYQVDGTVRFFVGYSGWERGQLEQELACGAWAMAQADSDPEQLFRGHGDAYWHRAVRALGEPYRSWRMVPRLTCAN